jgi:hypothetical protein
MNIEIIVGYDVRVLPSANVYNWDEKRKNDFLLRLDVESPLSTDRAVWPSLLEDVPQNQFTGHQGLWNNLEAVESQLFQIKESCEIEGNIIAITLLLKSCTLPQKQQWESMLPIMNPTIRSNYWGFLGYDVSDMWLLSSLSNCGFLHESEDVESMRRIWGVNLNNNHLFVEKQIALAFKDFADKRVKEHSPFFVFGLWLIRSLTKSDL